MWFFTSLNINNFSDIADIDKSFTANLDMIWYCVLPGGELWALTFTRGPDRLKLISSVQ